MSNSDDEFLRRSLSTPPADDFWGRLSKDSVRAMAERDPRTRRIVDEILGDPRAELDLRLRGAGVSGHATRASTLGQLLTRTSRAVKQLAKDRYGLSQLGENLLAVGPTAGSVRVVLKAPLRHQGTAGTLPGTESESVESASLRELAALLLQAEDLESPLPASLQSLHGEARAAVRRVGQTVIDGHWRLEGELRIRGAEPVEITLSEAGAQRLVAAANATDIDVETPTFVGRVDGWTWSTAVMRFEPEARQGFTASVRGDLQGVVAQANAEQAQVTAAFTVVVTYPIGDETSARRSYALDTLRILDSPEPLPIEP